MPTDILSPFLKIESEINKAVEKLKDKRSASSENRKRQSYLELRLDQRSRSQDPGQDRGQKAKLLAEDQSFKENFEN